jgi:hypothetical protein
MKKQDLRPKDGKTGEVGRDGLSAYEIAVNNGFKGSETDWIYSLKGLDGRDGKDGKDGEDGKNGKDGKDGKNGKNGKDGKDGKDGVSGKDGENGLSAYEIALKNGFKGNEEKWLRSLKGKDGKEGETIVYHRLVGQNVNTSILNQLPVLTSDPVSPPDCYQWFLKTEKPTGALMGFLGGFPVNNNQSEAELKINIDGRIRSVQLI